MLQLSPLALAAICLVAFIIVVLNVGLITLIRYKPQMKMKMPSGQNSIKLDRLVETLKDPYGEQRRQVDELSGLVSQWKEKRPEQDDNSKQP
jgi:hypothetical protein